MLTTSLQTLTFPFLNQENGQAPFYRWILSTGYWSGNAPLYPDSVALTGALCSLLIAGVLYFSRW